MTTFPDDDQSAGTRNPEAPRPVDRPDDERVREDHERINDVDVQEEAPGYGQAYEA